MAKRAKDLSTAKRLITEFGEYLLDKDNGGNAATWKPDGTPILSACDAETAMDHTERWLRAQVEGWPTEAVVLNNGKVGGKL